MIRIFLLLIFIFLTSSNLFANALESSIKNLTAHIEQLIKTKKIPGCAVAIVDHDKIIYLKTFGVRKLVKGKKGDPITPDTIFQLGSISKPITSTLVAILNKQGIFDMDRPLKDRLPWLHSDTTARHLLSHTTGYDRLGWNNKIEKNTPRIHLIHDLSAQIQNTPGETFDYHNVVFSLIEDLLAHKTNQSFVNVLKKYVFNPFGMVNASVGKSAFDAAKNKAWPHQITKKKGLVACSSFSQFYHNLVPSAGGMNATIRDMANFLLVQLNGHADIIHAEDLESFHTPMVPTTVEISWFKKDLPGADLKTWYGLGWRILDVDDQRIVYHGGWLKGFMNFMAFRPDRKLGIVILHNSEHSFAKKVAVNFLRGNE